ncbi:Concanavalin A-like lectin/glucanases superfamily protein [Neorhodopirellula lusitana]|uniref:Concanavalin A-like lectin/glucanases superfamily protein n=1 Tax=Neorhodopirellula lusitana TaxID=445327 RepID=A0ABY1QDM2_9BACT|nr:Concanavalin A-like lectin/glucanases superfamily protein [Neorhodopirellula lusitana]
MFVNDRKKRFELIRRCLDGEASNDEFAQLEDLLRESSQYRKEYLQYLNVDSALAALPDKRGPVAARPVQPSPVQPSPVAPPAESTWLRSFGSAGWLAVAAMLLFSSLLTLQSINRERNESSARAKEGIVARPAAIRDRGVAVLTRTAGLKGGASIKWQVGGTMPPGSMQWDSGLLQLEFYGGATVVAEGPAEIEILDESRLVCKSGRLRARVPEPARGFVIVAPNIELVDLGTEFGLDILDNGSVEVHVFDGAVELFDAESNRDLATRRQLNAGEAVAVDRDGKSITIASRDSRFVTPSRLNWMSDVSQEKTHRDWEDFRDSLRDDPRVVAYFPFDQDPLDDRVLTGYAGNGTTIEGAIVGCEWTNGRWSQKSSLQFKRPGDRVRITVPGEYESLSYSTWVRVDGLDRIHSSLLLTDGYPENAPHWQIRRDGGLILGVQHPGNNAANYQAKSIVNAFRLGQWMHLATVYDSERSVVKHYLNGELVRRQKLRATASGLLRIGKATIGNWSDPEPHHLPGIRNLNGCMDELIVFGEALTSNEVRSIHEVGRP